MWKIVIYAMKKALQGQRGNPTQKCKEVSKVQEPSLCNPKLAVDLELGLDKKRFGKGEMDLSRPVYKDRRK